MLTVPVLVALSAPALAGAWSPAHVLEGQFAVSSPPEAPRIAVNDAGHAIAVWDDVGDIRFAERDAGGTWSRSAKVVPSASGGPAVVAVGSDDTAAVAWVTVGTEFVPSHLVVSVRAPGASFGTPAEVALGAGVWNFELGIAGDGEVTLIYESAGAIFAASAPSGGAFTAPVAISDTSVSATGADLAVDDAGDLVVAFVEGGDLVAVTKASGAAFVPPELVSASSGQPVWSIRVGIDGAGDAAVAWIDGDTLNVASEPFGGAWTAPTVVARRSAGIGWADFALDEQGDAIITWQALDATGNGSVFVATAPAGSAFGAATRLSPRASSAEWPSLAYASDGSVAGVAWVDDTAVVAHVAVGVPTLGVFSWRGSSVGAGSWGGTVSVGAGAGSVDAAWAAQMRANPNAAKILARVWE